MMMKINLCNGHIRVNEEVGSSFRVLANLEEQYVRHPYNLT